MSDEQQPSQGMRIIDVLVMISVPILVGVGIFSILPDSINYNDRGEVSFGGMLAAIGGIGLTATWFAIMRREGP
jgi:hypothetical protein